MGNGQSAPIEGTEGYHVLRVQSNSPGEAAGLEPFFDFIVSIGSKRLDKDDESFKEILKQHLDKPLELTVYNSKSQTVRQTQIIPTAHWGGQGILGVSIRFCSFEGANQNVWHVISIQPNSPASAAGLIGDADYILGAESVLQAADDLISLVQANLGKPVKLYVYNINYDNVREVTLIPNDAWGGDGCLGCDIGYGYLHRIPISVDRSQAQPIENALANLSVAQQEAPKANVAQPGFTGIPQVDRITSTATSADASKNFPDPSEFLVNLPPASNTANITLPPNISTPQAPLTQPNNFVSPPNEQAFQNVASTAPIQSYVPPTEITQAPTLPVSQNGAQPNGQPTSFDSNSYISSAAPLPQFSSVQAPPTSTFVPQYYQTPSAQQPYGVQNNGQTFYPTEQQNLPPVMQPVSAFAPPTSAYIPAPVDTTPKSPQELKSELNQHIQLSSQMSSGSTSTGPINSSSYQPYLAYGAPPTNVPASNYQQFSPPVTAQAPPLPFPNYSMPPSTFPNTFIPQPPQTSNAFPPPIFNNLPMPSLSDLGIKELVPQPASTASFPPSSIPPPSQVNVPNF